MNKKRVFSVLCLIPIVAIVVSIFVPFGTNNGFSYVLWEFFSSEDVFVIDLIKYVLLGLSFLAAVLSGLNKKVEMNYLLCGYVLSILMFLYGINYNVGEFSFGFYLAFGGVILLFILTFIYSCFKSSKRKVNKSLENIKANSSINSSTTQYSPMMQMVNEIDSMNQKENDTLVNPVNDLNSGETTHVDNFQSIDLNTNVQQEPQMMNPVNQFGAQESQMMNPVNQFGAQEPQMMNPVNQFGAQEPQMMNPVNQLGAQEPQMMNPVNQFGAQEPQMMNPVNQFGAQEPQMMNPVNQFGAQEPQMMNPVNQFGAQEPQMMNPVNDFSDNFINNNVSSVPSGNPFSINSQQDNQNNNFFQ